MNIASTAKGAGIAILGLVVPLAFVAVGIGLLYGAAELSLWALKWTPTAFAVAFWVSALLLVPLAFIPSTRDFAANGFMVASYVFGPILWIWAMAFTYDVWGLTAVIIGLIIFGVGVVPVGMLAATVNGYWGMLGVFVLLIFLTYGCRALSHWLAEKAYYRAIALADAKNAPIRRTKPAESMDYSNEDSADTD